MKKNAVHQEGQTTENRTQQGVICFACLSFFPLLFIIGKMVMSLI